MNCILYWPEITVIFSAKMNPFLIQNNKTYHFCHFKYLDDFKNNLKDFIDRIALASERGSEQKNHTKLATILKSNYFELIKFTFILVLYIWFSVSLVVYVAVVWDFQIRTYLEQIFFFFRSSWSLEFVLKNKIKDLFSYELMEDTIQRTKINNFTSANTSITKTLWKYRPSI